MARTIKSAGEQHGWRSGLEEALGLQLDAMHIAYEYEKLIIPFLQPEKNRKYKPDYLITRNGIIIESKGRFVTADRQKHLLVKAQYPDLEIRFVFSNSRQRIGKKSPTSYAMWSEQKGFKYADKRIPVAWLEEPPNVASLNTIARLKGKK